MTLLTKSNLHNTRRFTDFTSGSPIPLKASHSSVPESCLDTLKSVKSDLPFSVNCWFSFRIRSPPLKLHRTISGRMGLAAMLHSKYALSPSATTTVLVMLMTFAGSVKCISK